MKAVVIAGGNHPDFSYVRKIIENADLCIAADSGYDWAVANGVSLDVLVGDFDSIQAKPDVSILQKQFPVDKDRTDTEISLDEAQILGADECILIGGSGGRLDHLYGHFFLFSRKPGIKSWYLEHDRVFLVNSAENVTFLVQPNSRVSVFPYGNTSVKINSRGLKWELDTVKWGSGQCGISNIAIDTEFSIDVLTGQVLVILPHEGEYGY